jgi:hypothetical protein
MRPDAENFIGREVLSPFPVLFGEGMRRGDPRKGVSPERG